METSQEPASRFNSITVKVGIIMAMILLFLIPQAIIRKLINERGVRNQQVINEINQGWAGEQKITPPVLFIPYSYIDEKGKLVEGEKTINPEEYSIKGEIIPQILNRRIYKTVVYSSDLKIEGNYTIEDEINELPTNANVQWDKVQITFGVGDLKGLKNAPIIKLGGKQYELQSEINIQSAINRNDFSIKNGLTTQLSLNPEQLKKIPFEINLQIKGSEQFSFVPMSKRTKIELHSSWGTPSFVGDYLPDTREVRDSGFVANWDISNSQFNYYSHPMSFGVKLLLPIDLYQLTKRSLDYAMLIICASFLVFFLFEVLRKKKVHVIQYLLVGISLCIFYTLLLSLSEHIGFKISYLIGSLATIGLITTYCMSIFKEMRSSLIMGFSLSVLYGYMYIILQMEDFALLSGSIGMFVVIAIVMYLTRKINWYGNTVNNE